MRRLPSELGEDDPGGELGAARRRGGPGAHLVVASLLLVAAVGLLSQQAAIRELEAWVSAHVVHMFGVVPATSMGNSVVFRLDGRWVGYTMAVGCSVTMLITPFFLLAAAMIASRRVRPGRALGALPLLSVALFAVNQARLLVMAISMRGWGFQLGYERSHVFLGSILSTLGVVAGLLLFVWMVSRERRHPAMRTIDV